MDVPNLIHTHGSALPLSRHQSPTMLHFEAPINTSRYASFRNMVQPPGWITIHPQNNQGPSVKKPLSLITINDAYLSGNVTFEHTHCHFIHHLLDPSLLPSSSVPHNDSLTVPVQNLSLRRWRHSLKRNSRPLIRHRTFGSHGTHFLWIYEAPGILKLQVALLPSPEESPVSYSVPSKHRIRDLQIEHKIDLHAVSDIDMDDAYGIIGIGTRHWDIHILYY
ncbi:hypothetical protein FRC03_000284 [Tulasnella sp. 419]|nr:hypothetical protein FRC03_000284 [Tulasnella sp. 419]